MNNESHHILNPHLYINTFPEIKDKNIMKAMIKGDYYYYHYNQDGIKDEGWGCAYRSLQTIISFFILNTSYGKNRSMISIPEIQKILVDIGDKNKNFINSNEKIGAIEINYVLNELFGVDNKIIYISSGDELISKGKEIFNHFKENGTPIMIGGWKYAYTILGIMYDENRNEYKYLILDPHYIGEDDINIVIKEGWCSWKSRGIFSKEYFYNLCLPLINK